MMPVFHGRSPFRLERPGQPGTPGRSGRPGPGGLSATQAATYAGSLFQNFAPAQDGADPRKWTVAGVRYIPSSVRMYLQGQWQDPATAFAVTISGADTVIQFDPSINIALADGQQVLGDGFIAP